MFKSYLNEVTFNVNNLSNQNPKYFVLILLIYKQYFLKIYITT